MSPPERSRGVMYSNSSSLMQDSSLGRSTPARGSDGEPQLQRPSLGPPTATTTGIGRTNSQRKAGASPSADLASKIDGIVQVSRVVGPAGSSAEPGLSVQTSTSRAEATVKDYLTNLSLHSKCLDADYGGDSVMVWVCLALFWQDGGGHLAEPDHKHGPNRTAKHQHHSKQRQAVATVTGILTETKPTGKTAKDQQMGKPLTRPALNRSVARAAPTVSLGESAVLTLR